MIASDRKTVDGVPVKVGDRVWFIRAGRITKRALDKTDLGMWWETITRKTIYSTQQAALDGAIAEEMESLRKARQEVRRATKAIERFAAQRAGARGVG
jgi:hypothetical protein